MVEGPHTVAAIVLETVVGTNGILVPPPGYLSKLRALARHHGILFVADEVITAFGRLGDWFASNLWNLDPDLITLAKGLTSGYLPLGATMVCDEIADVLLHHGAAKVYAVDVGHGQLAWKLRNDPRVVVMERVNARTEHTLAPCVSATVASASTSAT